MLNVQTPLRGNIASFVKRELIEQYHRDEAMKAITPIRSLLEQAGIDALWHILVENAAESIIRFTEQHGCQQLIMGLRRLGNADGWVLGLTVTRVPHQSKIPVLARR